MNNMHLLKKTAFFLTTLIIIAAGFFMPVLVSKGLNYHFHNSVEQIENKKISLAVSDSEEDIRKAWTFFNLTRLDPNVSTVEISEDSRACSFTYDKIKTVSLKILAQMGVSDYNDFKAVPNLVISINDEIVAKTSVFWRCEWTDKDNVLQIMWIDDDSGKMVGLIMNVNEIDKKDLKADKDSPDDSNSDIPEAVMVLVEYCKRNYLADDVRCRKEQDGNYIIEIINKEEDGVSENSVYSISVYLYDEYLYFNV